MVSNMQVKMEYPFPPRIDGRSYRPNAFPETLHELQRQCVEVDGRELTPDESERMVQTIWAIVAEMSDYLRAIGSKIGEPLVLMSGLDVLMEDVSKGIR